MDSSLYRNKLYLLSNNLVCLDELVWNATLANTEQCFMVNSADRVRGQRSTVGVGDKQVMYSIPKFKYFMASCISIAH